MSLCPSLSAFRFSAEGVIDLGIIDPIDEELPQVNHHLDDVDDENDGGAAMGEEGGEVPYAGHDYGGDNPVDFFDDGGGDGAGYGEGYGYGYGDEGNGEGQQGGGGGGGGGERDLVLSMDGNGDQMFDYFDASLTKNWAGPEHWKMRRTVVSKNGLSLFSLIFPSRSPWSPLTIFFSLPRSRRRSRHYRQAT